jgi:hypothetical protein
MIVAERNASRQQALPIGSQEVRLAPVRHFRRSWMHHQFQMPVGGNPTGQQCGVEVAKLAEAATTQPTPKPTPGRPPPVSPAAQALRAFVERYAGADVHPDALMNAAAMAKDAGEKLLVGELADQLENRYFDEPRVRVFLREHLGRMVGRAGESVVAHLPLLDGRTLHLPRDLFGKTVLVHFWSPKLLRSLEQLDTLKAIYQEYHSHGLEIVGVCVDRARDDLESIV